MVHCNELLSFYIQIWLWFLPAQHRTVEGYRQYFDGIVGFFAVEDYVMNITSTLVNCFYFYLEYYRSQNSCIYSLAFGQQSINYDLSAC